MNVCYYTTNFYFVTLLRPYFNIFFAAFTAELSGRVRKGGKYIRIVIERMPAKIYTERFVLHIKLFRFRKFRNVRQLNKASSYAFPATKVKKALEMKK